MNDLSASLRDELLCHGAAMVGFGDLTALPSEKRQDLPTGVAVAVAYPKDVIKRIADGPTAEYHEYYNRLNEKLDMLVTLGAEALRIHGYRAVPQTRAVIEQNETENSTLLPHKTVATRAGLGWIGKCALLVTKKYGSAIRISAILTDAPAKTAKPINTSKCGSCMACTDACPGKAVLGQNWSIDIPREYIFDAAVCKTTARRRAQEGFGVEMTICGKCIEACPHTRRYIEG